MKRILSSIKKVITIFFLVCLALVFTGCGYKYKGDHPDLYSVALNNIPAINGYISLGEPIYDPRIEILEVDSFGRVLFSYSESYQGLSADIVIMQYTKDNRVYYYSDDCYVWMDFGVENGKPDLNSTEIIELKQKNDWNMPINESRCDSAEIVNKKQNGEIKVSNGFFEDIAREYYENSGKYIHPKNISFVWTYDFVTSDAYGRELYIVNTHFEEYTDKTEVTYSYSLLVVVHPDKSYIASSVTLLEDPQNCQEVVKNVKLQNGWNTPR